MRLLLDTHTFLWFINGSAELSETARHLIENPANEIVLSIGSLWEIAIKTSLGKLKLAAPFEAYIAEQIDLNGLFVLNISMQHLSIVLSLPFHHRDPFDRLLVAQSIAETIPIISRDGSLDAYGVSRLW